MVGEAVDASLSTSLEAAAWFSTGTVWPAAAVHPIASSGAMVRNLISRGSVAFACFMIHGPSNRKSFRHARRMITGYPAAEGTDRSCGLCPDPDLAPDLAPDPDPDHDQGSDGVFRQPGALSGLAK